MTSRVEQVEYVLRDLNAKRARLLQQIREVNEEVRKTERAITLIDNLCTDIHWLHAHIEATDRRECKRVNTPCFSDDEEDGELSS